MEMKNAKLLARFPRDRKRWNAIVFFFQRFPQKKSTRNGTRKPDLELVAWTPVAPAPGLGQALKPSRHPWARGREEAVFLPRTAGRTPELRVPGPARKSLASPSAGRAAYTAPWASQVPPQKPGRQLHLLPKAQTPAPARTRSEQTPLEQAPPCWCRRVSGNFQREQFMERGLRDPGCPAGALALWAM